MSAEPRVALLVIGDGRDRLRERTLESFHHACLGVQPSFVVSVDDREHALGFCGAIQEGWRQLRALPGWDYVFHLEEDWRFDRPFRLDRMIDVLECDPRIAQVALRRGAVNQTEALAGGLIGLWPDEYADGELHVPGEVHGGWPFLRHSLFWTTNPSVYPRWLTQEWPWPDGPRCEEAFGRSLIDAGRMFAFWGSRTDGPWISHTGTIRTGKGY